jgi:hypothetical protein
VFEWPFNRKGLAGQLKKGKQYFNGGARREMSLIDREVEDKCSPSGA